MSITRLGCVFVLVFAIDGLAENNVPFLEDRSGQCLRLMYDTFGEDESVYGTVSEMLLHGKGKVRDKLVSICSAFPDRPDVLVRHVKELLIWQQKKGTFGTPLYNGTVFTTLPVAKNWIYDNSYNTNVVLVNEFVFGDFVDVDDDGSLDYVVSVKIDSSFFIHAVSVYYRAVFINVGNGWTMNSCETNMGNTFPQDVFLIPCP